MSWKEEAEEYLRKLLEKAEEQGIELKVEEVEGEGYIVCTERNCIFVDEHGYHVDIDPVPPYTPFQDPLEALEWLLEVD